MLDFWLGWGYGWVDGQRGWSGGDETAEEAAKGRDTIFEVAQTKRRTVLVLDLS